MADNVVIPATGSGDATPTVATDDVGGAHYQKIKVDGGGDGLSVPIVAGQQTMAASLPVVIASNQSAVAVSGPLTDTQLRATAVPVSGTVTASGPLTDTQLRATPVPVSGTVTASGPLTDTQLRATAVPISGTVTATVTGATITGDVTVIQGTATNLKTQAEAYQGGVAVGAAAPLQVSLANTGANATAVKVDGSAATQPVSGTVTAAQATAANLNATVVGAGTAGTANAGVVTVQGIASMTKLLVTPDANSAVNVAQINGVTPLMGNGATGTGALRVSIADDSTGIVALTTGSALVGYVGVKSTYAGKVTLTTTNWVSLANGSGWQSVAIDTTGARDVHFWLETQSTGTAYCDFYIATKLSNGTGYTDGATGTEGTFTAANRLNSRYLGSVRLNNAQGQGELCLSDIYGGALPKNIVLIGINNAGAAINSTAGNTVFEYELVN